MIKGKVEIIKDFGTSFEEVIYSDNNMIVDGAGEIISHMMTIPPDLNTISSASSIYDVSNFTIKAVSFGKAPLHYYYNAHQNSGAPKYGRTNASEVWVVATNSSGASSYTPPAYLPNAPVPTDTYLVNFNGITLPEEVVTTIINTIVEYVNTSGFTLGWGNNSTASLYKIPTNIGLLSSIKAGVYHFVALDPSGDVFCWGGNNAFGERTVPALPPCIGVGATRSTSFAITNSYNLSSWGSNTGMRDYPSTYASAVSSVEGGNTFFVILKTDGTVSAWGSSAANTTYNQPPASIQGSVKKIKSNWSSYHAAAILNNNTVSAWLVDSPLGADQGQTNLTNIIGYSPPNATKLSNPVHTANYTIIDHNYVITGSSVYGWGAGAATVYTPAITTPGGVTNVKKIAVSPAINTIALKNDGTVSAWGRNLNNNVLGFSSLNLTGISDLSRTDVTVKFVTSAGYVSGFGTISSTPAALQGITSSVIQGNRGTYYLTNTGHVSSVLYSTNPALSGLSAIPVALQGSCVAITAYDSVVSRCVAGGIRSDGKPFLWGQYPGGYVPATLSSVSSMIVGLDTCIALKTNGQVFSWNTVAGNVIPVPPALQGSCVDISLYEQTHYGLRSDGAIFIWNTPIPPNPIHTIPDIAIYSNNLSPIKDVATGQFHSLVLREDGTVSAYGRNIEGQCNVPSYIQGITVKIFAAENNSYAILNDGTGVAWGYTTPTLIDPDGLLAIPNDDSGNRKFYDFAINYKNAVGLYSSSVPYYTTITTTEEAGNSFYNSENFRQNTNLIPFKDTIVNKINVLNQTIDVIPSTVGALLDGAYPPSGGINVRIVSGFEPYTTVVSANVSGNFNTVGSMDFRGYVNVTSGTNPLNGLVTSSVNVSSNGELIYIVTIASGDCTLANLYGGVTQLGLWSYDLNKNIELGYNPPYAFRRYPEQTGTYLNPLRYKLFAKKVFNENILKIKDNGTTAGLKNHQNLTVRWRLYFA